MPSVLVSCLARRGTGICRAAQLVLAAVGIAVVAAACSSGSASPNGAGGSPSPSSSASGGRLLAYSECMRSHGITSFPDPNSQGGFEFNGTGVNPATIEAAQRACASLSGGGNANANSSQNLAKELKFAQCMRSRGIKDFPDPNSNGGFSGTGSSGAGAVDPQSPAFQSAQSACLKQAGLSGSGGSQ